MASIPCWLVIIFPLSMSEATASRPSPSPVVIFSYIFMSLSKLNASLLKTSTQKLNVRSMSSFQFPLTCLNNSIAPAQRPSAVFL